MLIFDALNRCKKLAFRRERCEIVDFSTRVERCRIQTSAKFAPRAKRREQSHESEITFQLVSNTVLFLITPLKSVMFSNPLRGIKIYNFRSVKQATNSCVESVLAIESCIWICMDSNGPCLPFRPLLWFFRLVPSLFLATFISSLHSPEIPNFYSPKRTWNAAISVEVLEKNISNLE